MPRNCCQTPRVLLLNGWRSLIRYRPICNKDSRILGVAVSIKNCPSTLKSYQWSNQMNTLILLLLAWYPLQHVNLHHFSYITLSKLQHILHGSISLAYYYAITKCNDIAPSREAQEAQKTQRMFCKLHIFGFSTEFATSAVGLKCHQM